MKRCFMIGFGLASVLAMAVPAGASDKSTAKKLVITKSDAGSGFVANKQPRSPDVFGEIADCVGKPVPKRKVVAHADGDLLVNDTDHSAIQSNVDIVKTKAMAKADRAVVEDPGFPDCFAEVVQAHGPEEVTGITSQAADVKEYGDFSAAFFSVVTGTVQGNSAQTTVVDVLIQKGRAELLTEFVMQGTTPFDRTTAEGILDKVANRIDAAKV